MTFKFEMSIGKQMEMDINNFDFFLIMDLLHPMIYLYNPSHK
jgi:hypothetical protein